MRKITRPIHHSRAFFKSRGGHMAALAVAAVAAGVALALVACSWWEKLGYQIFNELPCTSTCV